jgi:hypothetical protein
MTTAAIRRRETKEILIRVDHTNMKTLKSGYLVICQTVKSSRFLSISKACKGQSIRRRKSRKF